MLPLKADGRGLRQTAAVGRDDSWESRYAEPLPFGPTADGLRNKCRHVSEL